MEISSLESWRRGVHYLFTFATVVYVVTGLGITEYRTVEPLTGGILTKSLSFDIHYWLLWPFLILLALHIYLALSSRRARERRLREMAGSAARKE